MAIYKVSFVVIGSDHPGGITSFDHRPEVGEHVDIGEQTFEILEVYELVPPRGDYYYFHATCRIIKSPGIDKV